MTDAELSELLRDCPTLHHMAERGSWPSIRRLGLLSTSALLDRWGMTGRQREAVEQERRPKSVVIEHPVFGRAVVRDQKPMDDAGLLRCLRDGLTPSDWYRLLNERVFFWLTRQRLHRLLTARPYRELEHDVLELDAAALVAAYRGQISLSPINSGATKPFPTARGRNTFLPISEYPYAHWCARQAVGERVVELCVLAGVPDVARFVRRATAMKRDQVVEILFENTQARTFGRRSPPLCMLRLCIAHRRLRGRALTVAAAKVADQLAAALQARRQRDNTQLS